MTALAALLGAALAGQAASPARVPGLLASGLRERVARLYAGLSTASMRLSPDTAHAIDSLRCPVRATAWRLERDGGPRPGGSEVVRLVWTDSVDAAVRQDLVAVRVVREELVPVAQRRFASGEALDTAAVRWEWRRTDAVAVAPPRPGTLGGRLLRRGVGPGQEVWTTALEEPYAFHRKDRVRVVLDRRGAAVEADGTALDDGIVGKSARVQGPFGKVLSGRVQADSSVRVE